MDAERAKMGRPGPTCSQPGPAIETALRIITTPQKQKQKKKLQDLKNYSGGINDEILMKQDDKTFEIIIPRDPLDPDDKDFSVFWQYHMAAFAGQQLFNASESFAYDVPCPKKQT